MIRQKEPNYLVFFCYTIVHTSFITCPWLDELREQLKSKQQIRRRRKEKQSWLLYSYCYYYKILSSKSRNSRVNNNNNNDDKGKKKQRAFCFAHTRAENPPSLSPLTDEYPAVSLWPIQMCVWHNNTKRIYYKQKYIYKTNVRILYYTFASSFIIFEIRNMCMLHFFDSI